MASLSWPADTVASRRVFYPKADSGLHQTVAGACLEDLFAILPVVCGNHFGIGPIEAHPFPVSGTFHQVFRVVLGNRRTIVARFHSHNQAGSDYPLLIDRWAADALAGLEMPAVGVLAVDLTRTVCPWDYSLLELARGECLKTLDGDDESTRPYLERLGAFLAGLHCVAMDGAGLLVGDEQGRPRGVFARWADYLTCHLERHVAICRDAGVISGDEKSAILGWFTDRLPGLTDVSMSLLHGDPGSHNVFVADGEVTGLIDWEDALAGDPLYELAFWASFHPVRRWATMFRGYFGGRDPDAESLERFWLYFLRVALAKTVVRANLGLRDVPGRPPAAARIQQALQELERQGRRSPQPRPFAA